MSANANANLKANVKAKFHAWGGVTSVNRARALSLTNRQVNELNVCWNNVIRRVFGYHKWESVSTLLMSLERLNVRYLIMLRQVTFYHK